MPVFKVTVDSSGVATGVRQAVRTLNGLERKIDSLNKKMSGANGQATPKALTLLTRAFSTAVPIVGSLVGLFSSLASVETASARASSKHADIIEKLKGNAEEAAHAFDDMENRIRNMSSAQAGFEAGRMGSELKKVKEELLGMRSLREQVPVNLLGGVSADMEVGRFDELINKFASGELKVTEFREEIFKLGATMSESEQALAARLVDTSYVIEAQQQFFEKLADRAKIAASATESLGLAMQATAEQWKPQKTDGSALQWLEQLVSGTDAVIKDKMANRLALAQTEMARLRKAEADLRTEGKIEQADQLEAQIKDIEAGLKELEARQVSRPVRPSPQAAPSQPDHRAAAVSDIREEVARLNLSEQEYDQYRFDQKIAEYKRLKVPIEEIRALEEARTADLVRREEESTEDALQTRTEFWRDYSRLTGQGHAEYLLQSEESLRQRKEAYIQAGIDEVTAEKWVQEQLRDLRAQEETPMQQGIGQARSNLSAGEGSFGDFTTASMGSMVENYQNMALGLSEVWGSFFSDFSTGFSNSIGQAIWESESLGDSLYNVASGALSSLTSGLINLGIQWAITKVLSDAVLGDTQASTEETLTRITTQTGASIGAITAITTASTIAAGITTAAWTPAATAVSLGSFGANSTAAIAGIEATAVAAKTAITSTGFAQGGYTGNVGRRKVAGVVHGQEFVFDADSVDRIGVGTLEALRSGSDLYSGAGLGGYGVGSGGAGGMTFEALRLADTSSLFSDPVGYALGDLGHQSGGGAGSASFDRAEAMEREIWQYEMERQVRESRDRQSQAQDSLAALAGLAGNQPPVIVNIENYGSNKQFEVQQVSREEVRVIARDVMRRETPRFVAQEISNPNSDISKGFAYSTNIRRRR